MWTQFCDMHSGGDIKEPPYEQIYIEAPKEEAKLIFYNRFGHNPDRISCTCCGPDYCVSESKTLEKATEYQRRKDEFDKNSSLISIKEYSDKHNVLIIEQSSIEQEEKPGTLPTEGWIWID